MHHRVHYRVRYCLLLGYRSTRVTLTSLVTCPLHPTLAASLYTLNKTFGWRIRPTILANSRRTISSTFFQLKLGHGHFNSYLHKLGHSPYNTCLCGPKQTPMHLLLDCKISNIRT